MVGWRLCVIELITVLCITGIAVYSMTMLGKEAGEIVSTATGGLLGFLTRGILERDTPVWPGRDSLTDSERGEYNGKE